MSSLLHLDQIGRQFGGLAAVRDITLDVTAGSRHALIGPNGAGKTTLVNLIAGTLRPSSGTITFDGRDITRLPTTARARAGIGRTWQHPAIFSRLTVTANLTLALTHPGARPARSRRGGVAARAVQLADQAGLADAAHIPAGRLPYGRQRRLELAMALATDPTLLLLDEPSAGLDPTELARLADLLHSLDSAATVLLVDHNLDFVWSLADTVTVLHHGRHVTTGSPDAVRGDRRVQDAYLARSTPPAAPRRAAPPAGAALLRLRNLRAGYRGAPVLDGIDLDLADGEALAVLGRNGAGKTTLLNTIAGLLPAHPGSHIELAGQPLTGRRPHQRARDGLALVPQGRRLFGPLTVAEHLTCAQAAGHRNPKPTGQLWSVEALLSLFPALAQRLRHPASRLSGGEQQMLALARALLTQPRLLLLDEPSEGLAPSLIAQLATTLHELVADGLTVLIAEQNLALAGSLAHRIVVLDHGRTAMTTHTHHLAEVTGRLHALLGVADPPTEQPTEVRP